MKSSQKHIIGLSSVAFVVLMSACLVSANEVDQNNTRPSAPKKEAQLNQESKANSSLKTLDAFLADEHYKKMSPDQKFICILVIFLNDLTIKGHFSKFVQILISLLEDKNNAEHIVKKYPTINIQTIIGVLKNVKDNKFAAQIVLKLKNYLHLFPEEFKNLLPEEIVAMGVLSFRSQIAKRLAEE